MTLGSTNFLEGGFNTTTFSNHLLLLSTSPTRSITSWGWRRPCACLDLRKRPLTRCLPSWDTCCPWCSRCGMPRWKDPEMWERTFLMPGWLMVRYYDIMPFELTKSSSHLGLSDTADIIRHNRTVCILNAPGSWKWFLERGHRGTSWFSAL